ncbi:hypothetical protein MPTK1_6g02880 [Marchantia polymorpha subsp. ruderalis]|uniref:Uncharacterized protein n=2 Tax=Marchantia polymorpha TaxID=3197 RepID=A0AAF6BMX6_MARPO|nr:hypothetical protein MARPO_1481s0001 [Marchantia polymorpha]BBN13360.1 hypothetical protein Mp_6g02880 [Marchantia polymorpha subsp. ruderalis]|eukprot:PTQ26471.1 hypothetical protein MARPO_1481s0001 [Marchantia polymorpha]
MKGANSRMVLSIFRHPQNEAFACERPEKLCRMAEETGLDEIYVEQAEIFI